MIPRIVRELRRRIIESAPDVVITTTPSPFLAFEGNLACKPLRIPIVFDVRDTWLLRSQSQKQGFRDFIKRKIEGQCCWGARKILIVVPMQKEQLIWDHGIPDDRMVLATNGADLDQFNVKAEPSYDIVYLGAPSIYRDLDRVFQTFSYLVKSRPSTTIRYLGWVENEYTRHLRRTAEKLGLKDNMQYIPRVPHEEIPKMLASARIGIASLIDNMYFRASAPVKAYEYLASGLPIAILGPPTDCELRRLWQVTKAGVYETDPKVLAERLDEMLTNEEFRLSYAKRAKEAAKMYHRKTIAQKVYHEVLVPTVEGNKRKM